jgi:hypothetical protein
MKLKSKRGLPETADGPTLSFDKPPTPEELETMRRAEQEKQQQRRRELEDEELKKKLLARSTAAAMS